MNIITQIGSTTWYEVTGIHDKEDPNGFLLDEIIEEYTYKQEIDNTNGYTDFWTEGEEETFIYRIPHTVLEELGFTQYSDKWGF